MYLLGLISLEEYEKIICYNIEELREEKNEIMLKEEENESLKERLKEMKEFIEDKDITN